MTARAVSPAVSTSSVPDRAVADWFVVSFMEGLTGSRAKLDIHLSVALHLPLLVGGAGTT
jgi:hypothetical protein